MCLAELKQWSINHSHESLSWLPPARSLAGSLTKGLRRFISQLGRGVARERCQSVSGWAVCERQADQSDVISEIFFFLAFAFPHVVVNPRNSEISCHVSLCSLAACRDQIQYAARPRGSRYSCRAALHLWSGWLMPLVPAHYYGRDSLAVPLWTWENIKMHLSVALER